MSKVFISHTSDMADYPASTSFVRAAIDAVAKAGRVPVDMSYFPAGEEAPAEYCRNCVRSCDLYVGVIGWRYGSTVADSGISYTEMEFHAAAEARIPRLVFLLDEDFPLPPRLIDADRSAIDDFRGRLSDAGIVIDTFTSAEDLTGKVLHAILSQARAAVSGPPAGPDDQESFAVATAAYLSRLERRYRRLDLDVLTPAEHDDHIPILLRSVFVPQDVREDVLLPEMPKELWRRLLEADEISEKDLPEGLDPDRLARARSTYGEKAARPVIEVLGVPGNRLVVLLGDPGAGKSTLARYLILTLARQEPPGELAVLRGSLPLLIELRAYADQHMRRDTFLDFLEHQYRTEQAGLPAEPLDHHLRDDGRALVIFDGLDEIFDPKERETVTRQIAGFALRYPRVRVIVTSRVIGYRRAELQDAGFRHYMLQDLNRDQIREFSTNWFGLAIHDRKEEAALRRDRLLRAVDESPSIRELAGNPLLLTILAIIGRRQELPRERRAVYAHAATVLVEHWDVNRYLQDARIQADYIDSEDKKEVLRRVAWRMQSGRSGHAGNHIRREDLLGEFIDYLVGRYQHSPPEAKRIAKIMLRQFRERNFILSLYGGGVYGFVHRAFLEFFCADEVVRRFQNKRQLDPEQLVTDIFGRYWSDPTWREVLLLIAGMIDERFTSGIVDHLLEDANPFWPFTAEDAPPHHLLLAAGCIAEMRNLTAMERQGATVVRRVISWLEYLEESYGSDDEVIEDKLLPFFQSVQPRWPGREAYLRWYLMRGAYLTSYAVSRLTAKVAAALFPDDDRLRDHLRRRAAIASYGNAREGAMRAVAGSWPHRPETLSLLRDRALGDADEDVRGAAIELIGREWSDHPETPAFLRDRVAAEGHGEVRAEALQQLVDGRRATPDAFTLVMERLTTDPHAAVRTGALLAAVRQRRDHPDVLPLTRALASGDEHEDVRAAALGALADTWRDVPATFTLLRERGVADAHHEVRAAAVRAVAGGWHDHPDVPAWLRARAREDPHADVRAAAVQAVAGGRRDHLDPLPWLRDLGSGDADEKVRKTAVQAVAGGWRDHPETLSWLRDRAVGDTDDDVRSAALQAIAAGWRDQPDVLSLLTARAAADPSPNTRAMLVETIGRDWRPPGVLTWLRERAVEDGDANVRVAAVRAIALGWPDHPDVLPWLAERVTADGQGLVREVCVLLLGRGGHERAEIRPLLMACAVGDRGWAVRQVAVKAVADGWAGDPETLSWLRARAVGDVDEDVRKAAVEAVAGGWADHPETLSWLRARAVGDVDEDVRKAAVEAVAGGWADHPETLSWLRARAVSDVAPAVRIAAMRLAAALGPGPETWSWLEPRLGDDAGAVRREALSVLAEARRDRPETWERLRETAVSGSDRDARVGALRALGTVRPDDPETLATLRERIAADEDWRVAAAAVDALPRWWRRRLLPDLLTDGRWQVRRAALRAVMLGSDDTGAMERLFEGALNDPSWEIRRLAVQREVFLRNVRERLALLKVALSDPHPRVRQAAVFGLSRLWQRDPEARRLLFDRVLTDPYPDVRAAIVGILAEQPDEEVMALLRQRAVDDGARPVRRAAVDALAQTRGGDRILVWILDRVLRDGDGDLCSAGIEAAATGWPDDPRVRDRLIELAVSDSRPRVRRAAVEAVERIRPETPPVLPWLVERAVCDGHDTVREAAALAVARGWPDRPGIASWMRDRATCDEDEYLRERLTGAVARIWAEAPEVRAWLFHQGTDDEHWRVRRAGVRAVALVDGDTPGTVAWLRDRAEKDAHRQVRLAAVEAVARVAADDEATLPWLYGRADGDEDGEVRAAAVAAVIKGWRSHSAVREWARAKASDASADVRAATVRTTAGPFAVLRETACGDRAWEVRKAAVETAAEHWRDDAHELIEDRLANDASWRVRSAAATALAEARADDPEGLAPLIEAVHADAHGKVRAAALEELASRRPDVPAVPPLLRDRAVADEDARVRRVAIRLLAEGRRPDPYTETLIRDRALHDDHWAVRDEAVLAAAAGVREPGTVEWLRDRLARDGAVEVAATAVMMVGESAGHDPETLAWLREHTRETHHWDVRDSALFQLVLRTPRRDTTIVDLLYGLTDDSVWQVRCSALTALGFVHADAPGALARLRALAEHDPHPEVREYAEKMLRHISHRTPGTGA
ncbi:hypothetical protein GCM10023191_060290 [Actinoallomurus oryzae]|uniref:NACHT domain-containing protein n=1 Tax=Actinoallomurus oryzae TaxID=502180 RepID=A0ABP8QKG0_9ACTN